MAYPPVHYLKLKGKLRKNWRKKQKEIEALKRAQVRFSGVLRIRLIGDQL